MLCKYRLLGMYSERDELWNTKGSCHSTGIVECMNVRGVAPGHGASCNEGHWLGCRWLGCGTLGRWWRHSSPLMQRCLRPCRQPAGPHINSFCWTTGKRRARSLKPSSKRRSSIGFFVFPFLHQTLTLPGASRPLPPTIMGHAHHKLLIELSALLPPSHMILHPSPPL